MFRPKPRPPFGVWKWLRGWNRGSWKKNGPKNPMILRENSQILHFRGIFSAFFGQFSLGNTRGSSPPLERRFRWCVSESLSGSWFWSNMAGTSSNSNKNCHDIPNSLYWLVLLSGSLWYPCNGLFNPYLETLWWPLFLIGKGLVFGGWPSKIEVIGVPCIYL